MMDMDIFQLLYNHLEERHYNNICQNAKQDANYLKATVLENELNAEYEKLNLSDEQQNVIMDRCYPCPGSCLYSCCFPNRYAMLFFLANAVNRLIIASKKISGIHNRLGLGIPPILYFYLVVKDIFFPLIPPGARHCNMGV